MEEPGFLFGENASWRGFANRWRGSANREAEFANRTLILQIGLQSANREGEIANRMGKFANSRVQSALE